MDFSSFWPLGCGRRRSKPQRLGTSVQRYSTRRGTPVPVQCLGVGGELGDGEESEDAFFGGLAG
jgi:hypothetical protein